MGITSAINPHSGVPEDELDQKIKTVSLITFQNKAFWEALRVMFNAQPSETIVSMDIDSEGIHAKFMRNDDKK